MYRIVLLVIICTACNYNGKKSQPPDADSLLPFLKKTINPLLQNQETWAAKQKLDSILPLIKEKDNYIDMCSVIAFSVNPQLSQFHFVNNSRAITSRQRPDCSFTITFFYPLTIHQFHSV
jgi:hypothetical protein